MKIKESSRSSRKFNQVEKFKCPEYNQNCLGMQEVGKSESEKKKLIKIDLKMREMMKLTYKDVKTVIITIIHMFKMIQEYMNMIKRETVNVKKIKKTCRNENHNI